MTNTITNDHPVTDCINHIGRRLHKHQKIRTIDEASFTTIMKARSIRKVNSRPEALYLDVTEFVQDYLSDRRSWDYGIKLDLKDLSEMVNKLSIGNQLKELAEECDLTKGYLVVIDAKEGRIPFEYQWKYGKSYARFQTALYVPFSTRSGVSPRKVEIINQEGDHHLTNFDPWKELFSTTDNDVSGIAQVA